MRAKSIWKKIEQSGYRFYCVGCNRQRRIQPPAKLDSPLFYLQIVITTAALTVTTYPWLGLKGFAFFLIPVGLIFEVFNRMKMRAALVCPDCEFDPILYLVDRKKAAHQVEQVWRKKFQEKGFEYPEKNPKNPRGSPSSVKPLDTESGNPA